MATGGYDQSLDNRVTCSICLEPYKGRQPKLLPCFHTFCLPCLTQLANRDDSQLVGGPGNGNGAAAPVTLTCPTCRTPVPLPPAGVSGLHNNVYVDDSGSHDPPPLLCDLCEEGESAKLNCSTCKTYFCTRCRRTHDKLCKTGQVTEIQVQQTGAHEKILSPQASLESDVIDVSLTAVVQQLMQKQTETEKQVAMLQNQNALLCRDLASLHEKNGRERKEFDALQREVVSLKDKNAIVCQDNQLLRNDITKLQDHVGTLQGEVDKHQGELSQLKTQTGQTQGQGEITAVKNSQAQLTGEVASLKTQQSVLQNDQGKMQNKLINLERDKTRLQDDVKKAKADQGGMQSNFDRTRSKLQDDLKKVSTQVAFNALLVKNLEPKKDDIIVCGEVGANVGGGYNKVTGIFTAPVSGVYCFLANATPHSLDAFTASSAMIVMDGKDIAHVRAYGSGNCTAHVSLSVKAGEKVWLKSRNDISVFSAGSMTSFTGFLVQADM